jgi:hypothetical protein
MDEKNLQNWIHLDFKGMVPALNRLLDWLSWLRNCGLDTVLLEYEDRIQWKTFPGTCREVYSEQQWQQIHRHCQQLGLQVVPLIQCYGHLEWLLRHPQWTPLRCNGRSNLICPQNPQVRHLFREWIAEVACLHEESEYIHVGLDEVYHMADCPACQQCAAELPEGKPGVLLEHAQFVCETVLSHGKRPILWADMFIKGEQSWLKRFSPQVVFCDWIYFAQNIPQRTSLTNGGERQAMGASAIRCMFPPSRLMGSIQERVDNVVRWHEDVAHRSEPAFTALIHTVWARPRSLSPLYGPWEGWLPAFLAAGSGKREWSDSLHAGITIWEQASDKKDYNRQNQAADEMAKLVSADPLEEQALRWWELALRYEAEWAAFHYHYTEHHAMMGTKAHVGADDNLLEIDRDGWRQLRQRLDLLQQEIRSFLQRNQWSDIDEYMDSRFNGMRALVT